MYKEFKPVTEGILRELDPFIEKLKALNEEQISVPRNGQGRNIRQIVGHMVDSASNNIHRIVHLQYREGPVAFPNYASEGNNDRWIAIQNYEEVDWQNLLDLWKSIHLHFIHIVRNINPDHLENEWIAAPGETVSLREMVVDFPRHLRLHIGEIEKLCNNNELRMM